MEADGDQGVLRGGGVHEEAPEVRAFHPAHGAEVQEGARHAPRTEGHLLPAHHRGEEEPELRALHEPRGELTFP